MNRVLASIPIGRDCAETQFVLARALGMKPRELRAEIERIRKSGEGAICSDSSVGYWRPENAEEYAANIRSRQSRAVEQLLTVRGEKRRLRRMRDARESQGVMPWAS